MANVIKKPAGPSVCRYCSTKCTRDISSSYLYKGRLVIYSEMLTETFNIVVNSECSMFEDIFSYLICINCIHRLLDAYEFKKKVLECEHVLEQYILQVTGKSSKPNFTELVIEGEANVDMAADELLRNIKEEKESLGRPLAHYKYEAHCEEKLKGEAAEVKEADDSLKYEYIKEERSPQYDDDATDCDDEPYDQSYDSQIHKEEPVIEETAHKTRKQKVTQNIKLIGPQTRYRKAKIKRSLKPVDKSGASGSKGSPDGNAFDQPEDITIPIEESVFEESTHTQNIKLKESQTRTKKAKTNDSLKPVDNSETSGSPDGNAYDQPEDNSIPNDELIFEELAHKARKRKAKQNTQLKESLTGTKKAKKDSLKADRKSTKKKLKTSKNISEIDDIVESCGAKPDAAMINAKLIVKFATAYPFKVAKSENIGCAYCKEVFESKHAEQFRSHVDTAHTHLDKTIAISISPSARLTRVDVSNISCRLCPQTFQNIEATATHLKEEHKMPINLNESLGLVPIKLDSKEFDCGVCGSKPNGLLQFSRHMGSHFALNICPVCGKKTESRGFYHHACSDGVICPTCKQSFESIDARKLHYKISKSCLPYKCRDCGEHFNSVEVRQRHYVKSHGRPELKFPCTKCDQIFPYQALLTRHFNSTHSDSYRCNYCHERLWSNVSLRNHVARVHTLEKAYKCEFCECSYFEKQLLKSHMRKHDDSRKYHCKLCGRMFVRRYRLRDHIVKSHPGVNVEDTDLDIWIKNI